MKCNHNDDELSFKIGEEGEAESTKTDKRVERRLRQIGCMLYHRGCR